jgi:hypothetical protein
METGITNWRFITDRIKHQAASLSVLTELRTKTENEIRIELISLTDVVQHCEECLAEDRKQFEEDKELSHEYQESTYQKKR